MGIYKINQCDYCGNKNVITRPSPFMADRTAMMCEYCWNETQKEYEASNGEYIPNFQSNEKEYKETIANMCNDTTKATVTIIQMPVETRFKCPHCEDEVIMDINDFEILVGYDIPDWEYSKFKCPNCGKGIEIDYVEWD